MGDSTVTGYQILRKRLGNQDLAVHVEDTGSTDTTYIDTIGLEPETTYIYRMKAINEVGVSEWSNFVRIATGEDPDSATGTVPTAPENLAATSTADSVTLTWDDPDDSTVTGYQILRKKLGERDLRVHVEDTGSAETTYVDTANLDPEITYVYRVKAINDAGVGKWSNFVRVVAMGTGS